MRSQFVPNSESSAVSGRRRNRQRILEAIRRLGPISRADLAKRTRLSPPTVSALVDDLATDAGLLREAGIGASSGGRPPILLEFNAEYGCLVGVDIGSRMVRFALADLQGRLVARADERTRAESRTAAIDQVLGGIEALLSGYGRGRPKLFAIAVGAPGTTDVKTGRVIRAANLGWVDVPLRDLVTDRFQTPVHVDNDANMAALGERWQGAARQVNDFVFFALGAGVGAGVVVGGRLHRGHRWSAGEIGRMTLDFREWAVDFGARGYLESRVGAADIPQWPHARPLAAAAGSDDEAAIRLILDLARAGDRQARAIVDELAVYIGTAVANVVAVLDPELIVFGGGLSRAHDLLLAPVERVGSAIVSHLPRIEISALGDDAAVLGSVYSAMDVAEAQLLDIASRSGDEREARSAVPAQ